MISGGDTGFKKLSTINRRMFIFSAAKAVIFFGIMLPKRTLKGGEDV